MVSNKNYSKKRKLLKGHNLLKGRKLQKGGYSSTSSYGEYVSGMPSQQFSNAMAMAYSNIPGNYIQPDINFAPTLEQITLIQSGGKNKYKNKGKTHKKKNHIRNDKNKSRKYK